MNVLHERVKRLLTFGLFFLLVLFLFVFLLLFRRTVGFLVILFLPKIQKLRKMENGYRAGDVCRHILLFYCLQLRSNRMVNAISGFA
jgi:hypothetical protein